MDTKVVIGVIVVAIIAVIASWLIATPGEPTPAESTATENATTTGETGTTTTAGVPAPPGATSTQPVAVAAARSVLATKLGVDEKAITATKVETETWSDGCLGLGGPAGSGIPM